MLASILANWRLIVGGLVGVGLIAGWLYVSHLKTKVEIQAVQIGQLERDRDQAVQIARNNADAIALVRAEDAKALTAVMGQRDGLAKLLETTNAIHREIAAAPANDDGIVAPVLRRALDRLRNGARANPSAPSTG